MNDIEKEYERLMGGVVEQVIKDYKKAVRYLQRKRHQTSTKAYYIGLYNDCRSFFLNQKRLSLYTDLDGKMILDRLNKQLNWQRGDLDYD